MSRSPKVTVQCETCGRDFTTAAWRRRNGHRFCSYSCASLMRRRQNAVEVPCLWCRRPCLRPRSASGAVYCGPDCRSAYILRKEAENRRPRQRVCEHCGRTFRPDKGSPRFCSRVCRGANRRGPKSTNWKGWASSERGLWISNGGAAWAANIRKRVFCEMCHVFIDSKLQTKWASAHHIVPFTYRAVRCEPANGLLLCNKCHKAIHAGDKKLARRQLDLIHWQECKDIDAMEKALSEFAGAGFPY